MKQRQQQHQDVSLMLSKRFLFVAVALLTFIGITFFQYSDQMRHVLQTMVEQQHQQYHHDPRRGGDNSKGKRMMELLYCEQWHVNTDDWWTHHPEWHVSLENDTHYCFTPIPNQNKSQLFRQLYDIGFGTHVNCSNVITKRMINSGWGADLINVLDGLRYSLTTGRPFQIWTYVWHYAKNNNNSTTNQSMSSSETEVWCPSQDMFCYFLHWTSCPADPYHMERRSHLSKQVHHFGIPNRWLLEYMTRPKTWIRWSVYQFTKERLRIHVPPAAGKTPTTAGWIQNQKSNKQYSYSDDRNRFHPQAKRIPSLTMNNNYNTIIERGGNDNNRIAAAAANITSLSSTACVAMHVRRADVVLHQKHSRRYHAISEYVNALQKTSQQQYPKQNPLNDGRHHLWNNNMTTHFDSFKNNNTTTFLLLTDDANAIGEALVEYGAQYTWMYFDRQRHYGAEGGFENQIPSGDARMDVIALLAETRMVRQCATTLVYSLSSFAYYLIGILEEKYDSSSSSDGITTMTDPLMAPQPLLINIDQGRTRSQLRSRDNRQTKNISRSFS